MQVHFFKYQGTGNDFVIMDNRAGNLHLTTDEIAAICHRRFGIGADGLILLETSEKVDFKMVYYNSDGRESSMCGNGGRCIVKFAHQLGIFTQSTIFEAIDGLHEAGISAETVSLKMIDVENMEAHDRDFVLNTGSPHYVKFVDQVSSLNVFEAGSAIRNSEKFKDAGINVNFVEILSPEKLFVRTYERGVEDETLSCGTGVTAAAIAYLQNQNKDFVTVETLGGELSVHFEQADHSFKNIWLHGPADCVFEGTLNTKGIL